MHYQLPADVVCEPTPPRPVPILVGGTTAPALRRARRRGDGWLGIQPAEALDVAAIEAAGRQLDGAARRVLRIVGSAELGPTVARALRRLAAAGITDVVVDVDWDGDVADQAAPCSPPRRPAPDPPSGEI